MSAPLVFYFDVISPYAYLAWTQIHALAERHGRKVEPAPILFAALLNAYGHKGPAEIPPKRVYIFKDVLRSAALLGVPLAPPPAHPFNPLLALRVASVPMPQDTQRALIHALYRATWGGGGGVESTPQVVAAIAEVGLDPEATIREATSEVGKARVRTRTQEALARGVFGVPTIWADGEIFWGLDALGHLDRFLAGHDPIDPAAIARWSSLPSSASRI
ncbi:2-hydroxychromene-2-carboxylate isomerase [Haliangium sp. UPWRP_2]|uniref:2-hydroxychromene-2-carboxylate isomerase n=1 Tax=Haliangium sp. UPWRP_2 TaxID=1931276 RepID=UPI000B53E90A|nr:2-hydroxychromene-2-carboxylate isomerase [Haliangium sp. UPWRP_2]PSM31766.1 2-hydroxychromene-2-carboxylate isomerase [Haliangium sp. UPWRP_2]HNN95513.1 2-hydroxychromene-2-carboxylate isomerase [Pseudomonadota bacterium]